VLFDEEVSGRTEVSPTCLTIPVWAWDQIITGFLNPASEETLLYTKDATGPIKRFKCSSRKKYENYGEEVKSEGCLSGPIREEDVDK
jgi:hypothetical protein